MDDGMFQNGLFGLLRNTFCNWSFGTDELLLYGSCVVVDEDTGVDGTGIKLSMDADVWSWLSEEDAIMFSGMDACEGSVGAICCKVCNSAKYDMAWFTWIWDVSNPNCLRVYASLTLDGDVADKIAFFPKAF